MNAIIKKARVEAVLSVIKSMGVKFKDEYKGFIHYGFDKGVKAERERVKKAIETFNLSIIFYNQVFPDDLEKKEFESEKV